MSSNSSSSSFRRKHMAITMTGTTTETLVDDATGAIASSPIATHRGVVGVGSVSSFSGRGSASGSGSGSGTNSLDSSDNRGADDIESKPESLRSIAEGEDYDTGARLQRQRPNQEGHRISSGSNARHDAPHRIPSLSSPSAAAPVVAPLAHSPSSSSATNNDIQSVRSKTTASLYGDIDSINNQMAQINREFDELQRPHRNSASSQPTPSSENDLPPMAHRTSFLGSVASGRRRSSSGNTNTNTTRRSGRLSSANSTANSTAASSSFNSSGAVFNSLRNSTNTSITGLTPEEGSRSMHDRESNDTAAATAAVHKNDMHSSRPAANAAATTTILTATTAPTTATTTTAATPKNQSSSSKPKPRNRHRDAPAKSSSLELRRLPVDILLKPKRKNRSRHDRYQTYPSYQEDLMREDDGDANDNIADTNNDKTAHHRNGTRKSLTGLQINTEGGNTRAVDFDVDDDYEDDEYDENISMTTSSTYYNLINRNKFNNGSDGNNDNNDDDVLNANTKKQRCWNVCWKRCYQSCCFITNPKYTLRTQLMWSFGTVNLLTISAVIILCIIFAYSMGQQIQSLHEREFQTLATAVQGVTARYLGETLGALLLPSHLVDTLHRTTQDRFRGYPYPASDSDDDASSTTASQNRHLPFWEEPELEMDKQYTWKVSNMPLEWDFSDPDTILVTDENAVEHMQQRWMFYDQFPNTSTSTTGFHVAGICDPTQNDNPSHPAHLPDCTDDSNNMTRIELPQQFPQRSTTQMIFDKGADITPVLKSLFEANDHARDLGVFFKNSGLGATVFFPHVALQSSSVYTSIGCDWMSVANPYDPSRPIATPEEIANCNNDGNVAEVSSRNYNPLERAWCRDQALEPDRIDVSVYVDAWTPDNFLLSLGRAVYDPITKEFVACTFLGVSLTLIQETLLDSKITPNSQVSVVIYSEDALVVATTAEPTDPTLDSINTRIDDINLGLSRDEYMELYTMVNYTHPKDDAAASDWNASKIEMQYEDYSVQSDDYIVTAYPIPPIPTNYDPNYRPEFFVILSTSKADFFQGMNEANDNVEEQVATSITFSLCGGAIGFVVIGLLVMCMASTITQPLTYMNQEAEQIMNNFGTDADNSIKQRHRQKKESAETQYQEGKTVAIGYDNTKQEEPQDVKASNDKTKKGGDDDDDDKYSMSCLSRILPRTELNDVVGEFDEMVSSFSGSLSARSERGGRLMEVRNEFLHKSLMTELYRSRDQPDFVYKVEPTKTLYFENDDYSFVNYGTNVLSHDMSSVNRRASTAITRMSSTRVLENMIADPTKRIEPEEAPAEAAATASSSSKQPMWKSPLFMWTVILIIIPLLLTTVAIATFVLVNISVKFTDSIDVAEQHFLDVELDVLRIQVDLRAAYMKQITSRSIQDLFVLTRVTSWLLFGALDRTDYYRSMASGIEECREYDNKRQCPYYLENDVCDCSWNVHEDETCTSNTPDIHRYERPFFVFESHDTLPNGNRTLSSYPDVSFSSGSTAWWDNQTAVPGHEAGISATMTGATYDTTYDRFRASAAMALFPALYGYADAQPKDTRGLFLGFEADGGMMGYEGCTTAGHITYSDWRSGRGNNAPELRPELCPDGKFGFDPRCRGWYDAGRQAAADGVALHVTAPYLFAKRGEIGMSATAPLSETPGGKYLGQSLIDFLPGPIFRTLQEPDTTLPPDGFPILVAVQDVTGDDAVLGPDFDPSKDIKPISQVVLKHDYDCETEQCKQNMKEFETIIESMKRGENNTTSFRRSSATGNVETIYVSYAPISLESVQAKNSSDFRRGVEANEYLIYSLGLAVPETSLLEPFQKIADDTSRSINIAIGALSAAIFIGVIFIIYVSYHMIISITVPVLYLLDMIRAINRLDIDDKPTLDVNVGSRELIHVSETMETLYKVVRCANVAYYRGELDTAYLVLADSLRLFQRLGNKKAIGIASNNLGNTMLAAYRLMRDDPSVTELCGLSRREVIGKGTKYYLNAIQLGEKAYDEFYNTEGWTPRCLDFMQHLSNRYFNRGVFLLTVKNDHEQPDEIERLGQRDLQICRDMDLEIIAYGKDIGWNVVDRIETSFQVSLVRVRGYNLLLQQGIYNEEWEMEEKLKETFDLVKTEMTKDISDLFVDISPLGRLQQIETELIKYELNRGTVQRAAQIGVRMVLEDAFLFVEAASCALEALQSHCTRPDFGVPPRQSSWKQSAQHPISQNEGGDNNNSNFKNEDDADEAERNAILHQEYSRHSKQALRSHIKALMSKLVDMADEMSGQDNSNQLIVSSRAASRSVANNSFFNNIVARESASSRPSRWSMKECSGTFVTMEDF